MQEPTPSTEKSLNVLLRQIKGLTSTHDPGMQQLDDNLNFITHSEALPHQLQCLLWTTKNTQTGGSAATHHQLYQLSYLHCTKFLNI